MKERIIGAIILVVFVVLVVPIFLDGPSEESEIVSERVLLPGQAGQDTKTVVLNRERSEPIPVANGAKNQFEAREVAVAEPAAATPVPEPLVQQTTEQTGLRKEQESAPQQQTEAPKPVASSTGMWAVQLGSFSNKRNAQKLAAGLRKQGYSAFLSQLQTSTGSLHRVRIGPQKDRASAEETAAKLLKVNHKGQVVPHP